MEPAERERERGGKKAGQIKRSQSHRKNGVGSVHKVPNIAIDLAH